MLTGFTTSAINLNEIWEDCRIMFHPRLISDKILNKEDRFLKKHLHFSKMFNSGTSWLVAFLIGLVTLYVLKYILDVRRLPSGPFPLPIIGSLLVFLKRKDNLNAVFKDLAKKYDGIYTLWVGSVPFVFVANWELCKEGLLTRRNDIISRPYFHSVEHALKHTDAIVFRGNTKEWEVSRKVGSIAVRKFSDSEILAKIVHQKVEEMLDRMLAIKGPFNPMDIVQETVLDIIAETAFGTKKLSETDLEIFKNQTKLFHESMTISPGDFSPILWPLFKHIDDNIRKSAEDIGAYVHRTFQELKTTYNRDESRHFADSIISAKIEAEDNDNADSKYLDDDNVEKIVSDLFLAGTDTTTRTLQWVFLAFAQFPEIQEKIRREIAENIGSRIPQQEDRLSCHYTWAFISEILRIRAPSPMMIPHATNENTELGGHKIPKGTTVVFDTNGAHFDPSIWNDPEKLDPERFLDADGQYTKSRLQGYLVFGEGKRNCIGEKMARNDIFLTIANIVQKVKIVQQGNNGSPLLESINNPIFYIPKNYEISIISTK